MVIYPITAVLDYLISFIACLRIGVIPVSVYPPNPKKLDQDLKKFTIFLENAQSEFVITTLEYKRFVQISSATRAWPKGIKKWLATDALLKVNIKVNEDQTNYDPGPNDIAFIQYTSGSTGNPRGVPVHYKSFMNTMKYGINEFEVLSEQYPRVKNLSTLIWLPIYHDYGLITSLMGLNDGKEIFVLDPISFIQNPLLWPEAIERYSINCTAGPNFSYALVARKIRETGRKFDLSCLLKADLAAEPIAMSTIKSMNKDWGIPSSRISHR